MSILARYKKPGGFKQLLQLIETSAPAKQEQLLKVVEKEDPDWADLIRAKSLTIETVYGWGAETLYQITSEMLLQYVAILCKKMPAEVFEALKKEMPVPKMRELEDKLLETKDPLDGEFHAAKTALFEKIRQLDEDKVIMLRMIDPALALPEAA